MWKAILLVDFVGNARPPADAVEERHVVSSTRDTAEAKRDHSAVCAASCRRPRGVSR
jgi:hypothetical protein